MRIISGLAGGTLLKAPRGRGVRPTSDRVKEALFASLGDIRGWVAVDLFAGAGGLGLEALSRGAAAVIFVEQDRRAVQCIRENLDRALRAIGTDSEAEVRVLPADVAFATRDLADLAGCVDLILADPPYRCAPGAFGADSLLRDEHFARWARGSLLVLEHATGTPLPWAPASVWRLVKQRRFGTRMLSFGRVGAPDG